MSYNFILDDLMRVAQEELLIKYKGEKMRLKQVYFCLLVIFPTMFASIYFGSSIPSVFIKHRWGEMGIGYFPAVFLCLAYNILTEWYKVRYVKKLKKSLIPCGCTFLEKHPKGIERSVSFYGDGTASITDDGVRTTVNLADYKIAVFGHELVLFLPRKDSSSEIFCVSCIDTLSLNKDLKKEMKCIAFALQSKRIPKTATRKRY